MNDALLSYLGLAMKAGKLALGHDAALEAVKRGNSVLIVLAADASERLEKEFTKEIAYYKREINIIRLNKTMAQIGRALPKKAGVISINDASFGTAIKKVLEEGC